MGHFFLLLGCKGIIPTYCCGVLVISKLKLCIDRRIKKTDIVAMGFLGRYIFSFLVYVQKKFLLEVMRIVIMFFNFLIMFFYFLIRNSLLIKLYVCDCSESNFLKIVKRVFVLIRKLHFGFLQLLYLFYMYR